MTVATVYNSSSGPKVIAQMNLHHVRAAHAKLLRDEPGRTAEIAALAARISELESEGATGGAAKDAAPAPPGHNAPPTIEGFDALKVHIEDLYAEAKNWCDGEPITTQAQADEVARLLGMVKEVEKLADDTRKRENEPFDAGKAEVQARYAPLISDTKAVRGKTVLAREACQRALTPWLKAQEAARVAAATAAREEAERKAAAARTAAQSDDLAVAERAEDIFADARATERQASALERNRAAAGGGEYRRAILRDNWTAEIEDANALLRHYWQTRRADLEAFALKMAQEDVRAGKRQIPGVRVWNDQRAA